MTITLYKGARGRGKTLSMIKDAYRYLLKGYKILRNLSASFGQYIDNEHILNLDKDSNIFHAVILIDEIQIFFDSRQGMRKENKKFSNFVQQTRKRDIHILCTTQYANTIDLRIRQHLDFIAFPNYIETYHVCIVTYIDVSRFQDEDLLLLQDNDEIRPTTVKTIFNALPIFDMYNTKELIV